ncbi:MAG: trigger factor [Planctomycetota bacterium]|nr:MAG: trigger factor [Planctomycetota bacterium]REJ88308.1 MAG: trigger factor [Planctomycetota bacterium]
MAQDLEATAADEADDDAPEQGAPEQMDLEVSISSPSACQRHVEVTIPRSIVDRYLDNAFGEMMDTAQVPGFRVGHAPRKLIEVRFRKEVAEQVKGTLLMDAMAQVNEDHDLTAISEPDLDLDAVTVPDDGPMQFAFDLEVRPEFEMPNWKGLKIERPTADFGDDEVDRQLRSVLSRYGRLAPSEEPAAADDFVVVNVRATHDGKTLADANEQSLRVRPTLSFFDGKLEKFDQLMIGAKPGDKKTGKVELSKDAASEELKGKSVDVEFEVLEIKKLELPELNEAFLQQMGNFETEADLRDAIKDNLERQLEYRRQQSARQQITQLLTEAAEWELPPELLRRQSERELQRSVLELQRSGFSDEDIRAHENELRQNSATATARALREHFILERIAEDQDVEAEPGDYDREVALIAMQSGESPRRVRAQLEKRGMMDSLRNQIIERKVIELVEAEAKFKDVPLEEDSGEVETIALAAGGSQQEIPEATKPDEPKELAAPKEHD